MRLDDHDLGVLAFERQRWHSTEAKHRAIAEQFGCGPVRYYQWLNQLVDNPAAAAAAPVLVARLRRVRDTRRTRVHSRAEHRARP